MPQFARLYVGLCKRYDLKPHRKIIRVKRSIAPASVFCTLCGFIATDCEISIDFFGI